MNKSLLTNLIATSVVLIAIVFEQSILLSIGLFALSGSLTNWLAIHMLFEKVPGLYGSGVIEKNFEQFKISISNLMMQEFFNTQNIQKFLSQSENKQIDLLPVIDKIDLSPAFDALKQSVIESSFGSMLGMFGGEKALDPLKEPFIKKMKSSLELIVQSEAFNQSLHEQLAGDELSEKVQQKIETIVMSRMQELESSQVKRIVQQLIKSHLGWLVIWGAVFGGIIGALFEILSRL
ncbi:MAG: DUF445 domain-containing protein [Saccharospirillaceae bacterium]|nr:DUF445 domain-containing protein [Pseudomonadales bacterium]NRB80570.1 DUF445 domain-containing protein [Saccharospirillaceae bacterium]